MDVYISSQAFSYYNFDDDPKATQGKRAVKIVKKKAEVREICGVQKTLL